jgi:RNA polymerase sigma-70 factor (ECF subfamily)
LDGSGFEAFFLTEYEPVLRTVFLMLADRAAAEDVTQESFMQAFLHWRKVSSYEQPGAWVRRVAIRLAGRRRARRAAERGLIDKAPNPGASLPDLDVRRALLKLPPAQRAAVILHYYEDRTVAEAAAVLGVSDGTVKTALHRARGRLAELLGEEATDVAR